MPLPRPRGAVTLAVLPVLASLSGCGSAAPVLPDAVPPPGEVVPGTPARPSAFAEPVPSRPDPRGPLLPIPDGTRSDRPPEPVPDPAAVERAVAAGLSFLGEPYAWGGRGTESHPGMDCLGLLFRAWGEATGTPWRDYPVDPSKIVASGLLGDPVPELDGVLRAEVDPSRLARGDVLYFLLAEYTLPDAPLWTRDGLDYWPWHTGMYLDDGHQMVLHAAPSGIVRQQPLAEILWDALYVTRRAARGADQPDPGDQPSTRSYP